MSGTGNDGPASHRASPPAGTARGSAPVPPSSASPLPDVAVVARWSGVDVWLADGMFLVVHHDRDGAPRLRNRVTGLVLAGALLSELVLLGRITVRNDGLLVASADATPTGEPTAVDPLMWLVVAEPRPRPVRDWLAFLAPNAAVAVGARLAQADRVQVRNSIRGRRFVPTDINFAALPSVFVQLWLERCEPMSPAQVVLAGLVDAAGLLDHVAYTDPHTARRHLSTVLGDLSPPLASLIAHTRAAVGNAVITGRT